MPSWRSRAIRGSCRVSQRWCRNSSRIQAVQRGNGGGLNFNSRLGTPAAAADGDAQPEGGRTYTRARAAAHDVTGGRQVGQPSARHGQGRGCHAGEGCVFASRGRQNTGQGAPSDRFGRQPTDQGVSSDRLGRHGQPGRRGEPKKELDADDGHAGPRLQRRCCHRHSCPSGPRGSAPFGRPQTQHDASEGSTRPRPQGSRYRQLRCDWYRRRPSGPKAAPACDPLCRHASGAPSRCFCWWSQCRF